MPCEETLTTLETLSPNIGRANFGIFHGATLRKRVGSSAHSQRVHGAVAFGVVVDARDGDGSFLAPQRGGAGY